MGDRILAPLGYLLGGTTYLVARGDGWVVARVIWPDGSILESPDGDLDEIVGYLTDAEDLVPIERPGAAPKRLIRAVYGYLGPMGLGVLQYQGAPVDGPRTWARVKSWPGRSP
jgi:hypothetical protein